MGHTEKQGKAYAFRLLSIKDRTKTELTERMQKKGFEEGIITNVIQYMMHLGYIDDKKYATHFAEMRAKYDKFGPHRILTELLKRGIEKCMAETVVKDVFPEGRELSNALSLANDWVARQNTTDKDRTKRRLYGYLARRGFDSSVIISTLMEVLD